ncbi:MAG TPA: hypothetical protein VIT43_07870 [Candidatus Dormibacteraeota bacterium]
MDQNTDQLRNRPEPAEPNQDAGQSEQDPSVRTGEAPVSGQSAPQSDNPVVPPASETWVEGQPTSEADYEDRPAE